MKPLKKKKKIGQPNVIKRHECIKNAFSQKTDTLSGIYFPVFLFSQYNQGWQICYKKLTEGTRS